MIGIAGPNLPHELLSAAGRNAGPLPFDPDRGTPQAARWLESKFMPWAFPVLEAWFDGDYDGLDAVLFSRADDTSQRLYYYLCELQARGIVRGPRPLIFDVAKIARPSSIEHTVAAVKRLADEWQVSAEALEQAIVAGNAARAPAAVQANTCLLYGTPPPDDRLHRVIGAQGFAAHGPTLEQSWLTQGPAMAEGTADPFAELGRHLHALDVGARSFADPAQRLCGIVRATEAKAVIVWRIEEDEGHVWGWPVERAALAQSGLPLLHLPRADWLARDGAVDAIARFLGGMT